MRTLPPLNKNTEALGAVFTATYAVRFSHCDPAAMLFYPQYFILLQGLIEDWFGKGLGID